jgi:hypothetical protein
MKAVIPFALASLALATAVPLWLTDAEEGSLNVPEPPLFQRLNLEAPPPLQHWAVRPLFSDAFASPDFDDGDAFPPTPDIAGIADDAPSAVQPASRPEPPRLTGIILTSGQALALVNDTKGASRKVRRGQSVEGWRLANISRSTATFVSGGEVRELRLPYRQQDLTGSREMPTARSPSENSGQDN